MITKVVIPAAGRGTRMLDLAKDRPKHLIDVLDRPFLYYVLKNLHEAGFQEMILVIGHHAERMIEFAENDGLEFPITLVNQFEVMGTEKYGTAIPLLAARERVGDDDFVCIWGDNLYGPRDLSATRQLEKGHSFISLLWCEAPEKYAVPILEGDVVKQIVEKPREFISNWASIGCYKFTADIFQECAKVELSERGEYELTDAIGSLAEQGKVRARKMLDYWLDFGKPEDVETVADLIREGKLGQDGLRRGSSDFRLHPVGQGLLAGESKKFGGFGLVTLRLIQCPMDIVGCHGFQYLIDVESIADRASKYCI